MSRVLPRALKPGDTIGMIAPSGSLKDPGSINLGANAIEALGFRVVIGVSCRSGYGYLAATDELRASDINAFFADSNIDGIVCMKGGYGTPRILDMIDYDIVSANPKVFAGYSDITGLHLAFSRFAGYPTFHTPMAISMEDGFDDFSAASWMKTLTSTSPLGRLLPPPGCPVGALVRGKARGPLIGGNLSLVAGLVGTPYALVPDGAILFLEDIGEEPYRLDRMLTQLRLAGVFERCAGILLGHWTNCNAKEPGRTLSLEQVFSDVIAPACKPTLTGFSAGHSIPTHSLPFGVEVVLDADAGTLDIVEPALA